jgi:hypothetical protein
MSGSTTQQTSSQTSPWGPQAGALTSAFSNAQNAYTQASQAQAPTNFTAQFTPDQLSTFQSMLGYANGNTTPGSQATAGATDTAAGTNATTGALTGLSNFNPASTNNTQSLIDSANKYAAGQNIPAQVANAMQTATQTANDITMPGIEQNAAQTGNTNSTRTGVADGIVQRGLAEQAANLSGTLQSNAYQNGLNLAETSANSNNANTLGALNSAGSIGNATTNTGVNAGTSSINNQGALYGMASNAGAGEQAANQANLTNQQQQYQSQVTSPYAALNGLMPIIGSTNWGGNSTGTSNTTTTPSAWSVIGGLLGGATQAAGTAGKLGWSPFSDRRLKTDINRVGTLDNGLPVYTFRYKDDPHQMVFMGLMAQEVEQVHPEAVGERSGFKTVDYEMASA